MLAAVSDNLLTSAFIVGLIVAVVQIGRLRRPFTTADVSGIALNNYLLYGVGIGQILTFALHPFQPGFALTSLAIGVAAIIVHGQRTDLAGKLAVVLAASIIGYAAPAEHIYQMLVQHDFAASGVSLPQVMAIVTTTLGIEFVIGQAIARQAITRQANARPARAVPSHLPEQLPDGGRASYGQVAVG
jgi:hypothetical protein